MKQFKSIILNKKQARIELKEFKALLDDPTKPELDERKDILPFFAAREQLIALIGAYNTNIVRFDRIATEFDIFGDHTADVAIGDSQDHQYCFVEFEDAKESSVFSKSKKVTPEWSARFNNGCSQVIDWLLWLENHKNTLPYQQRFGVGEIQYVGLLVIGRDRFLTDPALKQRLIWRSEQVIVSSRKLCCITFDKLYADLDTRLRIWNRK